MIKLTGPVPVYANVKSGGAPSKDPKAIDAGKNGLILVEETAQADSGTIVTVGDKLVSAYDVTNKQGITLLALKEDIPGVASKQDYLLFTKASNSKYTPPTAGDLGKPQKWQLLVDNLKVHTAAGLASKVIGKLKKGKVYTLQEVVGADVMHYCPEAKGYVAIADPKSGKPFWKLASDGTPPAVKPKKETGSGFGLGSEPSTPSYKPESDTASISTTTVLMIVGGAVLAFMLLTPPGGARKRARA